MPRSISFYNAWQKFQSEWSVMYDNFGIIKLCSTSAFARNLFLNSVKLNQIWIVITLCNDWFVHQKELHLVLDQSEKCNYNPNLVWLNRIQKEIWRRAMRLTEYLVITCTTAIQDICQMWYQRSQLTVHWNLKCLIIIIKKVSMTLSIVNHLIHSSIYSRIPMKAYRQKLFAIPGCKRVIFSSIPMLRIYIFKCTFAFTILLVPIVTLFETLQSSSDVIANFSLVYTHTDRERNVEVRWNVRFVSREKILRNSHPEF